MEAGKIHETSVRRTTLCLLALFLLWGTGPAGFVPGAEAVQGRAISCQGCAKVVDGYGLEDSDGSIQIVLVMDRVIHPSAFVLKDPLRVVVDLEPAWTEGLPRLTSWGHPFLQGPIRLGWHSEQRRLRLVLDLVPGHIYDASQDLYLGEGRSEEGARFVLRVTRTSPR